MSKLDGRSWLVWGWIALLAGVGLQAEEGAETARVGAVGEAPSAVDEERGEEKAPGDVSLEIGAQDYVSVRESHLPRSNTIATKMAVPLQVTPANVGVVSDILLREQGAVTLDDAVLNVSGINIQSGQGVHDYFLIRGFDSLSSGLVMTDGAAEPEVSRYHLYNVAGVEVFKGPAGFLYGSNPLAGAVNIVRKQPVGVSFLDVRATAGSFDTLEGALDWNLSDAEGDHRFRLNGLWRESANFRDDKDSSHFAINPSYSMNLGEDAELNLNLEYVSAEYQPDSGIPLWNNELPDVPREQSYQSALDFSDQKATRVQLDYSNALSDRVELRFKAYYRRLEWDSTGTLLNGVVPNFATFQPEVSRTLTRLVDDQQLFGTQVEAIMHFETGAVSHELLGGVELGRFTDEYTLGVELFLQNLDLFDPVGPDNPLLFPLPSQGQAGDAKSTVIAPYLVDQMRLSDRFQVLLGLRWDDIRFEDPSNGIDRDDSELSPMLGLVYTPTEDLTVYGNAGRSHAPASPRVQGEREPEQATQLELGVKTRALPAGIQGTLAVYHVERENIAIVDDTGFTQQNGDQRAQGVELELAAEPWSGGRALLAYSYNDAELTSFKEIAIVGFDPFTGPVYGVVDRSGNTPAFAPEHLLRLWVAHSFGGAFSVGGGMRYFSDQYIAEDNAYEIDGAALFDAMVGYSLPSWSLQLHLKNLTDEDVPTRGFASTSVIPAPGFGAFVTAEYKIR